MAGTVINRLMLSRRFPLSTNPLFLSFVSLFFRSVLFFISEPFLLIEHHFIFSYHISLFFLLRLFLPTSLSLPSIMSFFVSLLRYLSHTYRWNLCLFSFFFLPGSFTFNYCSFCLFLRVFYVIVWVCLSSSPPYFFFLCFFFLASCHHTASPHHLSLVSPPPLLFFLFAIFSFFTCIA